MPTEYATAIVGENGDVHFFDDVYRHDAVLRNVLAKGPQIQIDVEY